MLETVRSSRPVPEQAFVPVQERELRQAVERLAEKFAEANGGGLLVSEMSGPYGRADFVLVKLDEEAMRRRSESTLRPLRVMSEARLIASLSHRYARGVAEISQRSGLPPRSVWRVATALAREGHVAIARDERILRHRAVQPIATTAAFEAKVSDWRRALEQARKYSLWNRWTTVVMESASSVDILAQEARRFRIGIALSDKLVVPPRPRMVTSDLRLLASEQIFSQIPSIPLQ